jgi:hypothetical protein
MKGKEDLSGTELRVRAEVNIEGVHFVFVQAMMMKVG